VIKLSEKPTVDELISKLGVAPPFAVDSAPSKGNVFAWLLQMARDGSLVAAADTFGRAIAVVNRLAEL